MHPLLPVQKDEFKRKVYDKQLALKQTQKIFNMIQGQTGLVIRLKPQLSLNLSNIFHIANDKACQEIFDYYDMDRKRRLNNQDSNIIFI
jgi:hypothetical protein